MLCDCMFAITCCRMTTQFYSSIKIEVTKVTKCTLLNGLTGADPYTNFYSFLDSQGHLFWSFRWVDWYVGWLVGI